MHESDYLSDAIEQFRKYKKLADDAIARVDRASLFRSPGPETNSIAVIMKHISGNQRSRWRDFLTSDGEKPDRQRDTEFELFDNDSYEILLQRWEDGWTLLLEVLESLQPDDLGKSVTIRGEAHTVMQAVNRQLTHYPYHVGQIVLLARHYAGDNWKSLSIPKGASEAFNSALLQNSQENPTLSSMPDGSRVWLFHTDRELTESESRTLSGKLERFMGEWAAHGAGLAAVSELRYNRFIIVAVDQSRVPPSGCSIDALIKALTGMEQDLGLGIVDAPPVCYRDGDGTIHCVSRQEFSAMATSGGVTAGTIVFNETLTDLASVRTGRWETTAGRSWHGRAFRLSA